MNDHLPNHAAIADGNKTTKQSPRTRICFVSFPAEQVKELRKLHQLQKLRSCEARISCGCE
jgi:hypothetical protein